MLHVLAAVLTLVILVGIGFLMYRGVMFLLLGFQRREPTSGAAGDGLACARCASRSIERLPLDGISPHPGYVCQECGLHMRPRGSTLLYAVMLPLSLALLAFFTAGIWVDIWPENPPPGPREIRLPIVKMAAAAAVAGYSVWQLLRPTPQRTQAGQRKERVRR